MLKAETLKHGVRTGRWRKAISFINANGVRWEEKLFIQKLLIQSLMAILFIPTESLMNLKKVKEYYLRYTDYCRGTIVEY